ncbi:hypothetical protein [Kribbella sp. NPDC050470]|uniref:hypothetical protein n=1 Tax=unclassified Kribbella TaxID=2644121 RepID=UPI0037B9C261
MVRKLRRARGDHHPAVPVTVPGRAGKVMRNGGLLPIGPYHRGVVTFDAWLSDPLSAAGGYPRQSTRTRSAKVGGRH